MAVVKNRYSEEFTKKQLDIVIVGGGLVGSLEALYLARRGHRVRLYEYREGTDTEYSPLESNNNTRGDMDATWDGTSINLDIRSTPQARGRSINLALSVRGRRALKDVGLEAHMIEQHGIPMTGRRIHRLDGSTYVIPYDALSKQCIYSVGRNYLNSLLLQESETYTNVERNFNHKLVDANLNKGKLTFQRTDTAEKIQVSADLVIGADGAFSGVRKAMMKQPLFDYSQKYIEHGYLELCIPAAENGSFQMPANYLHIWPRGEFMMIALPNQDASWTVTLFMPFTNFKNLDRPEKLLAFFKKYFPDSIPLIGEHKLIEDFFAGSPSPLVAIKCRPYHVENKAVLIGDAAHAVVPFYGQGMNAGFEDCTLLDQLFQKHNDNLAAILSEFSSIRWEDTFAISDLAMYNYIEMRDLVTRPSYRLRKAFDEFLYWILPRIWVPLYNSVTFTTMPYNQCVQNRKWQDKILQNILLNGGVAALAGVAFLLKGLK